MAKKIIIDEKIEEALRYFGSDECEQKYNSVVTAVKGEFIVSSLPNEATGYVGPVQLVSSPKTLAHIKAIREMLPQRNINLNS